MSILDDIAKLAEDVGLAPPPKPLPIEQRALATALAGAQSIQDTNAPVPINQGAPFVEQSVLLTDIRSPDVIGGSFLPFGTVKNLNLGGEALTYRRAGSSPARLAIQLGGLLHEFSPGQTILAPFEQVSILQRMSFIGSDIGIAQSVFQGEAYFVVSKRRDVIFQEQLYTSNVNPWFRPVNVYGQGDVSPLVFLTGGFPQVGIVDRLQTLRFMFAGNGSGLGFTAADGDTLTLEFYSSAIIGWRGTSALQISQAGGGAYTTAKQVLTTTWPAFAVAGHRPFLWYDVNIAGWDPYMTVLVSCNNAHTVGYLAMGVA